jgi:phage shock protein PspC (stress-responsive transcriptional regulator)
MNTTPSAPSEPDQPAWGTPPATPPATPPSASDPHLSEPPFQQPYQQPHQPYPQADQPYPPYQQPPRSGPPGAQFFDGIRSLGVVRPDGGRRAAGVAAGLARRWNVEPAAVRIGFVLLTLLAGFGVTLYGLCWLMLPHPDGRIHAQQALAGTFTAGFVGALLCILISGPHLYGPLLPFLLIFLIIRWIIRPNRRNRYQPS